MKTVRKVVHGIGNVIMAFVAVAIMVSMLVSTADIAGARLFGSPLGGAFEGAANLMPVIVFVSLAYIQQRRQHVRVEFFYVKGSPKTRALLDIINGVFVLFFFSAMGYASWSAFTVSFGLLERSPGIVRFPLYPIKFIVVLGCAVMAAQMIVDLVDYVDRFRNPREDDEVVTIVDKAVGEAPPITPPPGA